MQVLLYVGSEQDRFRTHFHISSKVEMEPDPAGPNPEMGPLGHFAALGPSLESEPVVLAEVSGPDLSCPDPSAGQPHEGSRDQAGAQAQTAPPSPLPSLTCSAVISSAIAAKQSKTHRPQSMWSRQ